MKRFCSITLCALILGCSAHAASSKVPNYTLADPRGGTHNLPAMAKSGLVLVMTAPTLHDESAQKGWNADLVAARAGNKGALVFIEDMSASLFKGEALGEMHKDWQPGDIPVLLIDKTGNVRKAYGIAKNETKVYVYDKTGTLVYTYGGAPSREAAQTIWSKLK